MRRHLLTASLSSMFRRRSERSRRSPVPMWFGIFLIATVAACATGGGADPASPGARPSPSDGTAKPAIGSSTLPVSEEDAEATASTSGMTGVAGSALLAALPDEVFGHALTKVLVPSEATGGARWVRDLLAELGRAPSDLTVALAYDPEFPDLRVLAVRVRVVNADRLVGAYLAVAARAVRDLHVQARDFGGKHAVCFALSPASPMNSCVGARADVLFVATSS